MSTKTRIQLMIYTEVRDYLNDNLEEIVSQHINSPLYIRKVRDWVMESINWRAVALEIGSAVPMSSIAKEILENEDVQSIFDSDRFINHLARNEGMRNALRRALIDFYDSPDGVSTIDVSVKKQITNAANIATEQSLKLIAERIMANGDV
jgi:hypothetical protein